jgi:hypothetical protein
MQWLITLIPGDEVDEDKLFTRFFASCMTIEPTPPAPPIIRIDDGACLLFLLWNIIRYRLICIFISLHELQNSSLSTTMSLCERLSLSPFGVMERQKFQRIGLMIAAAIAVTAVATTTPTTTMLTVQKAYATCGFVYL